MEQDAQTPDSGDTPVPFGMLLGMPDFIAYHLIFALAVLYPLVRIYIRAGLKPWPAAFILLPFIGPAITLSVLIFKRWPNAPEKPTPRQRRAKRKRGE